MSVPESYRLTDHAREEAERRGIPIDVIDSIMRSPGQVVNTYGGRKAYQSQVIIAGKPYLVRIIVEEATPLIIVTVYRTSRIEKYWSNEP